MRNLLIICLIFLVFVTGCTQKPEKTTIKFSSWGSESELAIIKPLLQEFEKENPDIKVEFIHIPKNYFQKLQLLVASNLTPDVIFINNLNEPLYAENNVFQNLSVFLQKDKTINKKDFFPQSLNAFTYKGNLYALPRDVSNLVVYYNKDIFDKYKVPYPHENWTFQEFLETCRKLTKGSQWGVSFEEAPLFWLPYLWSNGGGLISKDLKSIIIDKPESIEALQFYANLRNKYHVAPTKSEAGSETMAQLFMRQKIAMHISGRWSTPKYRKDIKFKWNIAKFPRGKAGSIVDCDTSGWAISKSSKHPQDAWKLIKFLAGKNSIENFTKSGLIVPARIDAANSDIFLDKNMPPENAKIFTEIIPDSLPTPVTENYQEITDEVNASLEPLWSGEKTAKDVISKELVEKLNKKLRK